MAPVALADRARNLEMCPLRGRRDVGAARGVVAEEADGERVPRWLDGGGCANVVAPAGEDVAVDADEERVPTTSREAPHSKRCAITLSMMPYSFASSAV